jgi:hypothetical protein
MKKASEYREHADECRKLAASMEGDQRDQLLQMAENWDQLAEDRTRLIASEARGFDDRPVYQKPLG